MCRQKLANPPPPFYVGSDRSWLSGEKATAVEVDVQDVSQIRVVGASLGGDSIFIEDPTAIACCRSNSYSNYILAIYEGGYVKMVEIEFFKGDSDVMVKVVGARYKQSETDLVHDGLVGRCLLSLSQHNIDQTSNVHNPPRECRSKILSLRLSSSPS